MPNIEIDDETSCEISFALAVYLDDLKKEIYRIERKQGLRLDSARTTHAKIERWRLTVLNPAALCGELTLMDDTTIAPAKSEDLK